MAIHEISYPSYNGRDTIKAWVYTPIWEPRGIVQIVHGLGEHSRRYMHMILRLNDAGYVVCADDHVGHGKTASDSGTWGDYGDKGYMTTTEDEHTLRQKVSEMFPGIPYFMYGHSWGSMIARSYAANYGDGLAGLIICGAPARLQSFLSMEENGKKLVEEGKGSDVVPELLVNAFAGMTDRFENPKTPNDWIAKEHAVVADHAADPFNNLGNVPTVQSLYDMGVMLKSILGEEWAAKVPVELPIYNIGGDQDPVTSYGEGTYAITNWLCETAHQVKTKVYSGYRHEIHNEPPIRDEVEQGIIDFIDGILK